nr:KinB-signaling pathway activation protein [Paenibacillus roseus]
MAVGAIATTVTGAVMQWTDPSFGFLGFKVAGFNAAMMALVGTMIGAFSQMGFFAYLILNYIALSIFRKKYLWNAFQAYTTVFCVFGLGYMLYSKREVLSSYLFLIIPTALVLSTLVVCYFKVTQTNRSAFIPTAFLMFTVTFIEAWPAMSDGNANTPGIIFMFVPLFVCNAYQIMMLHRVLKNNQTTESAQEAKTVV